MNEKPQNDNNDGNVNSDQTKIPVATKILEAALKVIEREGISATTTRAIAAEANVNIAAINYYFRTKDQLVKAALLHAWGNADEDFKYYTEGNQGSALDRLESLILFIIEGFSKFPNLTKAMLEVPSNFLPIGEAAITIINRYILVAANRAAVEAGFPEEKKPAFKSAFLSAATIFPFLTSNALGPGFGIQIETKEQKIEYAHNLIQIFMSTLQNS